ncbi:hypothetical protein, partial [Salmonella enterica]|uniref:hypothetical protein n=1 Tax=Salmonella enterica TaxID=28901 RepID=UPI001CC96FBA
KRAYCLKTQPATGETYPKSDLFNKAALVITYFFIPCFGQFRPLFWFTTGIMGYFYLRFW